MCRYPNLWLQAVGSDADGAVYAAGYYASASATYGESVISNAGDDDFVVWKLNGDGTTEWAVTGGGTTKDRCVWRNQPPCHFMSLCDTRVTLHDPISRMFDRTNSASVYLPVLNVLFVAGLTTSP